MAKVGVYCRVSTLDQQKGIDSQEHAIQRYLSNHGYTAKWFKDKLSGAQLDRPGFKALQKAVFNGEVDTVIVWKLDRLSRSLRDGINVLTDWIEQGVRIISVAQQLDFNGPIGKMLASVLFALAEMERENLRENTKRGLAAAKARGVHIGREPILDLKLVALMRERGHSYNQIAKTFRVSKTAVYLALRKIKDEMSKVQKREVPA